MSFQRKVIVRKNDLSESVARASNQQDRNMSHKPTDKGKNVDAQRHSEEQNVDPGVYMQNNRRNLNGSPRDQKN